MTVARLEESMDVEEEAGWLEHFRMEAEETEERMKKHEREMQAKARSRR